MWFCAAWAVASALAADVYINGTYVEPRSMAGVRLAGASVRFDEQGNMYIDAPGYKVQAATPAPAPTSRPPTIAPPTPAVTYGRWWIVTEDQGSVGHLVDVYINGQLATTIRSGQAAPLVEISKWLHLGSNQILIRSTSTNASGGPMMVFAGAGSTENGKFDMPSPTVEYGLAASRKGNYQREYTLLVDR